MRTAISITTALLLAACGGDEPCDPVAQTGCDQGFVCANIDGSEETACFVPVVARGQVFDLETSDPVEGARVVALDVNRSPVSSVAITDADGNYEVGIPSVRDENGVPIGLEITLRADAAGYQTFPGGLRRALPIDTATAVDDGEAYLVQSALTDVGLIPLVDAGGGSIHGVVDVPATGTGVLVVTEGPDVGSAIADSDGNYEIFNLAAGSYEVTGYAVGHNYEAASVDLGAGERATADLGIADTEAVSFTGSVNIVNPGEGTGTSVIMVVESTFDENLVRGEAVPGLRAPSPGEPPTVTGQFTIDGVPDGRYAVLAAFEDDNLVRDPDTCIAGTDILHQEIAGADVDVSDNGFKVTGALDVIKPGARGAEEVVDTPVFEWVDDSSEDQYDLQVIDSFGELVWETTMTGVSGGTPSVTYEGPALEAGMYYQFRVVSSKSSGGGLCELSTTEDLKGVFYMPAP